MSKQPTTPTIGKPCRKVPQIMQMEGLECGAACLSMICAYYGKWMPLEKVRTDCDVGRDGAKALNVMKAARSYGMTANGFRMEPEMLREKGQFPCIAHWGMSHFVVIRGFRGNSVLINDPSRGEVRVSLEEFDEAFTGIVMQIAPGPDFEPSGSRPSIMNFLRPRLKGSVDGLVFATVTTALLGLFGLATPLLSQSYADKLIGPHSAQLETLFITILLVLCILQVVVSFFSTRYSLRTEGKLAAVGASAFIWRILHLPMDFFSQRSTGDLVSRVNLNIEISKTVLAQLAPIFINFLTAAVCLVIMGFYSLPLACIGLLASVLKIIFARIVTEKRTNLVRVQMRSGAMLDGASISGIQSIETLKATGSVNVFMRRWTGYQASENLQNVGYFKLGYTWGLAPQIVTALLDATVLVCGLWLIFAGRFTVGMVLAFQGILALFSSPLQALINAMQSIQETTAKTERIEDVMNYPLDPLVQDLTPVPGEHKLKGAVRLENISFGYSRLGKPLIQDFSLDIKPGQCVALVGASGCGKSTALKLVTGLYQPWEGEVFLDDRPMNEVPRAIRCGSIAAVSQDILLFADTIANNIRLLDDSIEDFEIIMAAKDAQIFDAIMEREGGFSYMLKENGTDFSGGQRQCIEIARALAMEPSIMVLDEATSALDAATELKVLNAIKDHGCTVLMAAHRLSAIRDCDEIIVIDKGCIVQRGTHDELIEQQDGLYAKLVTKE